MDIGAWAFLVGVIFAVAYLFYLDKSDNPFKLVHFVSSPDGHGSSGALAYTGSFLLSAWLVWYAAEQHEWTVASTLMGGVTAIAVAGGSYRQYVGSRERISSIQNQVTKEDVVTTDPTGN